MTVISCLYELVLQPLLGLTSLSVDLVDVGDPLCKEIRCDGISVLVLELCGLCSCTLYLGPGIGCGEREAWTAGRRASCELLWPAKAHYSCIKFSPILPVMMHPISCVSLKMCVTVDGSTSLS